MMIEHLSAADEARRRREHALADALELRATLTARVSTAFAKEAARCAR